MALARANRRSGTATRLLVGSRALFAGLTVAFLLASLAGTQVSLRAQAVSYVGLMGTVGLVHGGFEHVANLKGRGDRFQLRYLLAYVGLIAVALGAFVVAPGVGLALALGVTVCKGGWGGLAVLRQASGTDPPHLRFRRGRAIGALVRGGAVMVVPYVAHPGIFSAVAAAMVALFDPAAVGRIGWAFEPRTRGLVGAWYIGLVLAYVAYGALETGGRAWIAETAETVLLIAYFAVVPPILAVGVYFPCWYALRQVARTAAAGETNPSLWRVGLRVLRGGLAPWVGAVSLLAGLALWVRTPTGPVGWVALYSVFVATIAVPHVVVGSWLDRTRGIWTVS